MTFVAAHQSPHENLTPQLAPIALEMPTAFADRIGRDYVKTCDDDHRKSHGLYLTPPPVATFMAGMIRIRDTLRILDPAAGAGILLCATVEGLTSQPLPPRFIEIVAYEIDPHLSEQLDLVLSHLKTWAEQNAIALKVEIRRRDFILDQALSLAGMVGERFDAVIANPPYFKIGKNDPRALAARSVVHGQPNIYGLFMAVGAAMLRPDGDLVCITPRSFAAGPYFKRFRKRFFSMVRPVQTHIFASRRDAFGRDDVLQENIILHAVRDNDWAAHSGTLPFTISSSAGIVDLGQASELTVQLTEVIDCNDISTPFRLPTSLEDEGVLRRVDAWTGSLHAYDLEISTGPVVPFRATKWLAEEATGATVPLLWLNHVRAMDIQWPTDGRKPQYIVHHPASRVLLLPNANYVILRRFSAKEELRRLTAAPLLASQLPAELIGIENHLNYIYRPGGSLTEDESSGLAALLNSALLDGYFRCINGNTQVSATELRALPLPPLEAITQLGRRVRSESAGLALIDELVEQLAPREGRAVA